MKKILLLIPYYLCCAANAQNNNDYSFLNGVPAPETITTSIKEDNLKETYAKQFVALDFIVGMLDKDAIDHTENRNAKESKLIKEYHDAQKEILKNYQANVESLDSKSNYLRWHNLEQKYLDDEVFKQQVVNEFLSADAKAKFKQTGEEVKTTQQKEQEIDKQYSDRTTKKTSIDYAFPWIMQIIIGIVLMIIARYMGKYSRLAYREALKNNRRNILAGLIYGVANIIFVIGLVTTMFGVGCTLGTFNH